MSFLHIFPLSALVIGLYLMAYHLVYWKALSPSFKGKTVFITGASSGIGEELAI